MNFERSELLKPILDDLEADDQTLFNSLQQRVLTEQSKRGILISTQTVSLVFQALRDKLSERAERIVSEIRRVLTGTYVEDFDNLLEALKQNGTIEWNQPKILLLWNFEVRLHQYEHNSRIPICLQKMRSPITSQKLRSRWFREIELFCTQLHDSQAPRLFLKTGEVSAGNRAARAIFNGATQSLDIIDTYFGPRVFDMLELSPASVKIRLISNRADEPTKLAYRLFNQQFNNRAEFRLCDPKTDKLHDRFIIVDGASALHLGGSIKGLGINDSLIDAAELDPHKQRFEDLWQRAQLVV